ncbi:hypothetical protein [Emcibacter sp.]|uniref:hypothetical protein n=1 Tax=Emcibacter sp. TaxID=1979954 RepID=UPI002AA62CBC|nr:hypothetical protein [Emcibacter sp.]
MAYIEKRFRDVTGLYDSDNHIFIYQMLGGGHIRDYFGGFSVNLLVGEELENIGAFGIGEDITEVEEGDKFENSGIKFLYQFKIMPPVFVSSGAKIQWPFTGKTQEETIRVIESAAKELFDRFVWNAHNEKKLEVIFQEKLQTILGVKRDNN